MKGRKSDFCFLTSQNSIYVIRGNLNLDDQVLVLRDDIQQRLSSTHHLSYCENLEVLGCSRNRRNDFDSTENVLGYGYFLSGVGF